MECILHSSRLLHIHLNGQHQGQLQEQGQRLFLWQEQDLMQMLLLLLGLDS